VFRVHGPFLLTDNRANIKRKEPVNDRLIHECEQLLIEALRGLRDGGQLTPDFLAVLPNDGDELAECCQPLRSAMIDAMRREALVPADDTGHAPASQLVRGPKPIRAVIDREKLSWLSRTQDIRWAAGVMANSRQEKLLESLGIRSWGWDELLHCLEARFLFWNPQKEQAKGFLAGKSDGWMLKFYALLGSALQHRRFKGTGHLSLSDKIVRPRDWALVRTLDGQHLTGEAVSLSEGIEDHDLGGVPLVKPELLQGKEKEHRESAISFLKMVGVQEIGQKERIKSLLNTRYSPQKATVICEDNEKHMRLFLDYFNETKDVHLFKGHPILIDSSCKVIGDGDRFYIDSPFVETGLAKVFDVLKNPNGRLGLWEGYSKLVKGRFLDFARCLGVIKALPIQTCSTRPKTSVIY